MARAAWRSAVLNAMRASLRFGMPAIGLLVIGHATIRSVGGDIQRWQFALGVLVIAAGFAEKLVPER